MHSFLGACFACLEASHDELVDVSTQDSDSIPFLEKLRSCVSLDLEQANLKVLCLSCVGKLRNSYNFQQMILISQRVIIGNEESLHNNTDSQTVINQNDLIQFTNNYMYTIKDKEKLECSQDANYLTVTKFENHENPVYHCYHCKSSFDKRWKVQKHIVAAHIQYKNFLCTYCNRGFKQLYHLKEHLTTHTGEKNFICPYCCKPFQRLSSMHRHARAHQRAPGEKTKRTPFLCTICGKSFPYSNGVQRHMRVHSGVRNHECHFCLRRFSQSTHLQVHMRTHTGEKPFICETCGISYSLNASLLKHVKIHKKK